MTRPGEIPSQAGFEPGIFRSRGEEGQKVKQTRLHRIVERYVHRTRGREDHYWDPQKKKKKKKKKKEKGRPMMKEN